MTVKELITELLNYPMDREVFISLEDPDHRFEKTGVHRINSTNFGGGLVSVFLIPEANLIDTASQSFLIAEIKRG